MLILFTVSRINYYGQNRIKYKFQGKKEQCNIVKEEFAHIFQMTRSNYNHLDFIGHILKSFNDFFKYINTQYITEITFFETIKARMINFRQ